MLFGLITLSCAAQTDGYKFYSKLDSVKTSGFYNIELTPEITAHLKTDYSDLRIINNAGKWVPHVLHATTDEYSNAPLIIASKFSITENSDIATTLIIVGNRKMASSIDLLITNTAAERFCTLSGSSNKQNWFVINDSIVLNPTPSLNGTENISTIDFPPTNYPFYKIVIHNKNKDPFNIRGVFEHTVAAEITNPLYKLNENPVATIQQKDSGKISYIKITQQLPYHFDNISLQFSGVKYYDRKIDLYVPDADNSSFASPGQLLKSFTVSNNSTLQFNIPLTKASVFYLLINNEDNLPLTVNSVKAACSNHYITTYLENGSNYRLIIDNADADIPNYDLSKLNSKIPGSISFLQFGKITAFAEIKPKVITAKNNKWILWVAIGVALLILLFFTYKMLKEVDKRKTT